MSELPLIIHTEASKGKGGQEMRIFAEMDYMRTHGYRCAMVAPADSWIYNKCKEAQFEVFPIGFAKLGQIADFFRLSSLFRRLRPQVVSTHS